MKTTSPIIAATALFATFANAAAINGGAVVAERASTQCYTVHSGYLAVWDNGHQKSLRVNSNQQVTYGAGGTKLQVDFQSCPKVGGNYPDDDQYAGRIKYGSQCLTVPNSSDGYGPFYLTVAPCVLTADVPSQAQTWTYSTGDDPKVVYWRGNDVSGSLGYESDGEEPVVEDGTHRIKLGGNEFSNFAIVTAEN